MKNNIVSILFIVFFISGTGCKKYLETAPDLRAKVNTPTKVSELLVTAYPHANYQPFCEAISDNAEDKGIEAGGGEPINRDPWFFEEVASRDSDSPDFYWYGCYKAISAANQALEVIRRAGNPQDYVGQKGEALVARAYAHFMLVTIFSKVYDPATAGIDPGIPYVLEPEKEVLKKYSRKTVAEVYEQIEKDLTEGLPLLSAANYSVSKYHFTPAAAHAFASRFYLFKRDYAKVVEHANLVFPGGDITPNLRDFVAPSFRKLEAGASDMLYSNATNPANILLQEAQSWWGRNFAGYRYGLTIGLARKTIRASNVSGGTWTYRLYGRELNYNMRKFKEHFVYTDQGGDTGDGYNMITLFSAEEVLFNRAEANAQLGNQTDALKDLNAFGSKRLYTSDADPVYNAAVHEITLDKINNFYSPKSIKEGIIKTILDFKRNEFMFEGIRWFDILRHNLPVVHTTADLTKSYVLGPNDPRRVFQIPKEVEMAGIERNPR